MKKVRAAVVMARGSESGVTVSPAAVFMHLHLMIAIAHSSRKLPVA
jgi:hypothetical protein